MIVPSQWDNQFLAHEIDADTQTARGICVYLQEIA